jgi:hypothetical protein
MASRLQQAQKLSRLPTPEHLVDPNAAPTGELDDPAVVPVAVKSQTGKYTDEEKAARKARGIAKKAQRDLVKAQAAAKTTHWLRIEPSPTQRDELKRCIGECWDNVKIYEHFTALWNVPESVIRRWVSEIFAKWVEDAESQSAAARHRSVVTAIETFVRKCYAEAEAGNPDALKAVPNALDKLARCQGAYQPERVKAEVSGGIQVGEISDDMVKNRIQELLAKHGSSLGGFGHGAEGKTK